MNMTLREINTTEENNTALALLEINKTEEQDNSSCYSLYILGAI
jgi:hypothetical protein